MAFNPSSSAPPAGGAAVNGPKAIVAGITGVLVALAIWGGRLEVIPTANARPSSATGAGAAIAPPDSANSQAARRLTRESGSRLPACRDKQSGTSHQSQKSSSGGCAVEHAGRAFSAGASPR
jgi:hypothetical protein